MQNYDIKEQKEAVRKMRYDNAIQLIFIVVFMGIVFWLMGCKVTERGVNGEGVESTGGGYEERIKDWQGRME